MDRAKKPKPTASRIRSSMDCSLRSVRRVRLVSRQDLQLDPEQDAKTQPLQWRTLAYGRIKNRDGGGDCFIKIPYMSRLNPRRKRFGISREFSALWRVAIQLSALILQHAAPDAPFAQHRCVSRRPLWNSYRKRVRPTSILDVNRPIFPVDWDPHRDPATNGGGHVHDGPRPERTGQTTRVVDAD